MAGVPTTAGSKFFADHLPDEDATIVSNLTFRRSNFRKTNMHEIALGVTGANSHYGGSEEPLGLFSHLRWVFQRFCGGSFFRNDVWLLLAQTQAVRFASRQRCRCGWVEADIWEGKLVGHNPAIVEP